MILKVDDAEQAKILCLEKPPKLNAWNAVILKLVVVVVVVGGGGGGGGGGFCPFVRPRDPIIITH